MSTVPPTVAPTIAPTQQPTANPTATPIPTANPTTPPTIAPTATPQPRCQSHGSVTNGCMCPMAFFPGGPQDIQEIQCPTEPACQSLVQECRNCLGDLEEFWCDVHIRSYPTRIYCTQHFIRSGGDPNFQPPFCVGKPVIYLYPTTTTTVSVRLEIPGEIYISDPLYPIEGWQNVTAFPDGTLWYQGKEYKELYYESAVHADINPATGLVIEKDKLKPMLTLLTSQLGLIGREQEEFLEYWLPQLSEIDKPAILFSVMTPHEKEAIDKVFITPEPTTRIEFLVYFKGVDKNFTIDPLMLPTTPPARNGFTMVEWGGTIDPKL